MSAEAPAQARGLAPIDGAIVAHLRRRRSGPPTTARSIDVAGALTRFGRRSFGLHGGRNFEDPAP